VIEFDCKVCKCHVVTIEDTSTEVCSNCWISNVHAQDHIDCPFCKKQIIIPLYDAEERDAIFQFYDMLNKDKKYVLKRIKEMRADIVDTIYRS
jgi:hypothetical protein